MSGPRNGILATWGSTALRPVELPSGMRALVKLPDVRELVLTDSLPSELREIAFQYAKTGIDVSTLEGDAMKQFIRFTYELVARSIRYMAPADSGAWEAFRKTGADPSAEGWQAVSVSASELQQMEIDPLDIEALSAIAGRQKSPNEVTALSRFDRGLLDGAAVAAAAASEQGARVGDFAPFRQEHGGADGGADREDVRPATERPALGRRPRRRVRS